MAGRPMGCFGCRRRDCAAVCRWPRRIADLYYSSGGTVCVCHVRFVWRYMWICATTPSVDKRPTRCTKQRRHRTNSQTRHDTCRFSEHDDSPVRCMLRVMIAKDKELRLWIIPKGEKRPPPTSYPPTGQTAGPCRHGRITVLIYGGHAVLDVWGGRS